MKKNNRSFLALIMGISILLMLPGFVQSCSKTMSDMTDNNNGNNNPGANDVFIQSMAFAPDNITVSAGTTVKWTNKDPVSHTVTSNTGAFDSGNISSSGTYSFKFNSPGSYPYHCTLHPSMTGTVTVN